MPKKISNNNCSFNGINNKFKELDYMTNIDHTISTGNKYIDKGVAKIGGMLLNHAVKDPRAKLAVKGIEKVYPYVETGAANIARAKTAYKEVCHKKK